MKTSKTGRDSDQFTLRFPDGMRARIKEIAERNRRTTNAELIYLIEQGMKAAHGNITTGAKAEGA
ncbi:Arc family DNA-binding protein [Massilia sp. YIM B02763]|uniref:Arc family DNA-binding protein n=1 Tax=Massilia sp. YIM B02763 TaxID=3050130 RepID=UPI0025B67C40|nr:Arc family DNA-binding protein [Massilia sp. YIM B02763]MDN4052879.1 Arc family DNA-binding protein [Massilia sp. YIM B02763]